MEKKNMLPVLWCIPAIICALYGVLILSLDSGTRFYAVWFMLAGGCALAGALTGLHLWQQLPAAVRLVLLLMIFAVLAVFVLTESAITGGFREKGVPNLDALIVLGAQVRENGPSVVLRYRLDTACAYLQENAETICIVSGGQGENEPCPEAAVMKAYLVEKGISADRILTESQSRSTVENIRNSMALIDPAQNRVGIVTNNFHLYRGCAIAEKAGIRHVCGLPAASRFLYLPNNLLREFFGVVKDCMAGNMDFHLHMRRTV